jgi:hypothetical protein
MGVDSLHHKRAGCLRSALTTSLRVTALTRWFAPFVGLLAAVMCLLALDLRARCCSNQIGAIHHVMTLQLGWSIRARLDAGSRLVVQGRPVVATSAAIQMEESVLRGPCSRRSGAPAHSGRASESVTILRGRELTRGGRRRATGRVAVMANPVPNPGVQGYSRGSDAQ